MITYWGIESKPETIMFCFFCAVLVLGWLFLYLVLMVWGLCLFWALHIYFRHFPVVLVLGVFCIFACFVCSSHDWQHRIIVAIVVLNLHVLGDCLFSLFAAWEKRNKQTEQSPRKPTLQLCLVDSAVGVACLEIWCVCCGCGAVCMFGWFILNLLVCPCVWCLFFERSPSGLVWVQI